MGQTPPNDLQHYLKFRSKIIEESNARFETLLDYTFHDLDLLLTAIFERVNFNYKLFLPS